METEEQKRKKGLELLFGESDDEEALEPLNQLDPFLVASDEEEDVPLPSFKLSKSGNPVKRRKKEQPTDLEEGTIDPEQLKKSEVQRDIDDALSRINNRVQTNDLDEAQLDEIMIRIVTEMKQTAQEDQELNKQKLPAINKLKYLSVVNVYFEKLNRPSFAEQFLDNHLLEGFLVWLEPLKGDFSLPSLEIQRKLMAILKLLPIRTDHLRETGLGRVIMFYAKCDRVLPEIKKIVAELLDKWMRPIMKRSDDYKDRYVIEKSPSGRKTSTMEEEVEVFGKDDARNHWVQVPVVKNSYEFVPKSSVGISKEAEKSKGGSDRFRKITKKK